MTDEKNSMRGSDDGGYILAVLLIGMAIAAVWLSASLPAWRHQAQREKEAELTFRGEQYARAIALFYIKNGTFPTDIDTLVSQRYLRKKWKDPITGEDFLPILAGQAAPTRSGGGPGGGNPPGGSGPQQSPTGRPAGANPGQSPSQTMVGGGIQGVVSKSEATSIKIYAQAGGNSAAAQQYNLWNFNYLAACTMMGMPGCRAGGPGGGPGGPGGGGPGGRGPGGNQGGGNQGGGNQGGGNQGGGNQGGGNQGRNQGGGNLGGTQGGVPVPPRPGGGRGGGF